MYIMVVKTAHGINAAVSAKRMPLKKWAAKKLENTPATQAAWRMHDGSDWCDGCKDAWRYIDTVPSTGEILV